MRKLAIVLALATCLPPLPGQFQSLATNADGSVLYATSSLVLEGMPANLRPESRIYSVIPSVAVAAERAIERRPTNSFGSSDGADSAQTSSDNQVFGYTLQNICDPSPLPCIQPKTISEVRRGTNRTVLGEGMLHMSRNGRWALLSPNNPFSPSASATLIELATGDRSDAPVPLFGALLPISSDGTILVNPPSSSQPPALWRNGILTPLPLLSTSRPLALSDNSQVVVYNESQFSSTSSFLGTRLRALNLQSGQDALLYDSQAENGGFPTVMGLSDNGHRVLYRIQKQSQEGASFLADTSTGSVMLLPLLSGELATAGTLSGNGDVVFLVTTEGRIARIRIDPNSMLVETVVPATPAVTFGPGLVPGSLARLHGTSLPNTAEAVQGHILFGDRPAPILLVSPGEITIQVPWELQGHEFDTVLTLDLPSASPFRQRQGSVLLPRLPMLEQAPPGVKSMFGLKFLKADFSGYVTELPHPGEILQLYMTGLGAVQGDVQTGKPAQLDSLRPSRAMSQCRFTPQTTMADTLFEGLAPGLIGIYQVTFRMPQEPVPPQLTGMNCGNFIFSGPAFPASP